MKKTGIYMIQSKVKPSRIYIGSAVDIKSRWHSHLSQLRRNVHINKKLRGHFNKYGESDLCFSILICCDKSDLIKHEQYFMDVYNPSFNLSKKAGSQLGFRHSLETRQKLSDIQKGKPKPHKGCVFTDIHKENISKANKGKHHHIPSPESIEKNRLSHLGKTAWNKGMAGLYKASEETKRKMSEAHKKRVA